MRLEVFDERESRLEGALFTGGAGAGSGSMGRGGEVEGEGVEVPTRKLSNDLPRSCTGLISLESPVPCWLVGIVGGGGSGAILGSSSPAAAS